eukprot:m.162793 g.162793  ORF g.162793 m.162793 type:complete len:295 (-) comp14613_c0_seq1:2298-3182(-)
MEGAMLRDTLRLGSLSSTVTVGAITQFQQGFQESPANGIMGVSSSVANCNFGSFAACSDTSSRTTCAETALTALLAANNYTDRFGVCAAMGRPGVLSLGGANTGFYTGELLYTPLLTSSSNFANQYFSVELIGFGINGVSVCTGTNCVGASPAIVDTGTAITSVTGAAYRALNQARHPCRTDADCLVDFQLCSSSPICLRAAGLMTCSSNGICIIDRSMLTQDTMTTIGYTATQSVYVEFDRTANRIGFAERSGQSCSVPCSAFLTQFSCRAGGCTWSGSRCNGGQGAGSTSRG